MKIAIGSDHSGFDYKEQLEQFLLENGHSVEDFGTHTKESCDYPKFIRPIAEVVASTEFDRG